MRFVSALCQAIVEGLPDVSLCIVESYGGHLVEWLHRGEMDLAIIYGPSVDLHLTAHTLGRDDLVAIGPKDSGLAPRERIDMEWLVEQKLVLLSRSHGLRALIEKAAARTDRPLNISIEADSFRVLINRVEEGLGYTILPPSAVRVEIAQGRLETARISKPTISRELILAFPGDHQTSAAAAATLRSSAVK